MSSTLTEIRRGQAADLAGIAAVQAASPEAARWDAAEYLRYDLRVAAGAAGIQGFAVTRTVAEGEHELLNLAVAPQFRRRGVGRALVRSLLEGLAGVLYLEVRESNLMAQNFYKCMGFQEVGRRPGYYRAPPETAIVMKFHSC
jgi:ribosomal-protein-alanine N-acetyltransferase